MLNDREISQEFQENYRYARDYWAPFTEAAQVATLAASGRTWSINETKELAKEGREPIEFNIMRQPLQFFSGYLRDNLNSIIVSPVEGSDQKTADQFTTLSYYIWDKGQGYNTFLDASDEGFKSGISLCGIYMDYSKDMINGDIGFYKRTYNSFYLDPTFERIDLKDCGFCAMRDLLDRNIIKQMLPFIDAKEIDNIQRSYRDDKFLTYNPNFTTFSRTKNLIAYDQYYRRTSRERTYLIDESAGYYRDISDLPDEDMKKLKLGMKRIELLYDEAEASGADTSKFPPKVRIQNMNRDYIELHIMLNGQRVYTGEDKTGITGTYPFVPCLAYLEPSIWDPGQRLQGISQTLYSNQRQFNKGHMKIIDMINSSISTGYKYLIGSVPDVTDLQQAGQNKLIGIDPEHAPQGLDSVQELKGGDASPSLIQYQQILTQLNLTLANVNESILGIDDKGNTQVSGRLAEVRIAQGLRSNRKLMDNVETAQQILGNLVVQAIQNKYPAGKVKRILGEDPTSQFYDQEFEQYDAVLKEGVRSKSQRDAYYTELVNLKREGIVDVPQSEIIDNLPMAGQSKLKDTINQQMQAQAQQQQKMDQQELSTIKMNNAKSEQDIAMAQERRAKVLSEVALAKERIAAAEESRTQATLDRVKTINEIAGMETDRFIKVMDFIQTLEASNKEENEEDLNEDVGDINTKTEGTPESKEAEAKQQLETLIAQMNQQPNAQQGLENNVTMPVT
jgi:hypothetical protein